MRIRNEFYVLLVSLFQFSILLGDGIRRLGKLEGNDWETHANLANNVHPFQTTTAIPDFSVVGALISSEGTLGTATLIAPNFVITAAHVLKNRTNDPLPDPADWEFVLHNDFSTQSSSLRFQIRQIIVHPDWIIRQNQNPPLGDGDKFGVDIALVQLSRSVLGVQPIHLPNKIYPSLGQKVYVSGFGNLVAGESGNYDDENSRRMAGVNVLDRIVSEIVIENEISPNSGGLLAFDFDGPDPITNSLGAEFGAFENLPSGSSNSVSEYLEVSTAEGDSGGPLLTRIDDRWRILGVVSYGSSDSSYGDITVFSRLGNHTEWINSHLPEWPSLIQLDESGWMQSDWLGIILPFSSGWNFHAEYGWIWTQSKSEDSMWIYFSHLGWLWVSRSTHPYFYSFDNSDWLYFKKDGEREGGYGVYDFAKKLWSGYSN